MRRKSEAAGRAQGKAPTYVMPLYTVSYACDFLLQFHHQFYLKTNLQNVFHSEYEYILARNA